MTTANFAARFLEEPSEFPVAGSGRPWGEESVAIDFLGGPYLFDGLSAAQASAVEARFGELCVEPGTAAVQIGVRVAELAFRELDLRGWVYTLDQDARPELVRVAGLRLYGAIRPGRALSATLWMGLLEPAELLPVVENFLRVVAAYRLVDLGGALLHSSAVLSGGQVSVFYGHSGAGKSTSARMSHETGREVLSDDLNGLAFDAEGRAQVVKLRFTGDFAQSAERGQASPLGSTYLLKKGAECSVRPLSAAIAVASLFSCCPYVNSDRHRQAQLMDNLARVARTVRCQELTFSLEQDFWCILEGLAEEA